MENEVYDIVKNIPLKSGLTIKAGNKLQKTHGVYYLNGMMLPPDYQKDFSGLVYAEKMTGWNYLAPLKTKTAWSNSKEDK